MQQLGGHAMEGCAGVAEAEGGWGFAEGAHTTADAIMAAPCKKGWGAREAV